MKPISIAAQWGAIRRVYPIYTAVAEEFTLSPGPYESLDGTGESETAVIEKVQGWLAEMDELVQPHQFRYILDRTDILSSEERLRALVRRYLDKDRRTDSDREKLHYLLNQYIFVCSPPSFRARDVTQADVAQVLESVLGEIPGSVPDWLAPVAKLTAEAANCTSLKDLQALVLTPGRELKAGCSEAHFSATALVVSTHFNYNVRQAFTRLLDAELKAIEDGISELDSHQVGVVDCRSAGFGEQETLDNLRQILDELRASTSPAYSHDAVVLRIQALRLAIECAVRRSLSNLTDSDERRVAAMEDQIQQLTRDLARTSSEVTALGKVVARLIAQLRTAPAVAPAPCDAYSAPTAPKPASAPAPEPAPAAAIADTAQNTAGPGTAPAAATSGLQEVGSLVQHSIGEIRRSLANRSKSPSGVVTLGTHAVLLSPAEIDAMNATTEVAAVAQQAIALRTMLLKFVDDGEHTRDISGLAAYAHNVLADLQKTLGSSNTPMRDALAVSARQLRSVLQHAEQAARKARVAP